MRYFTALLVLAFFSGCSPTMVPVMTKSLSTTGEIIDNATPYITEASVAKSIAFYDMHIINSQMKLKAFELSGVKIKFDDTGRIKELTARSGMPNFDTLPQKVDEYPAWAVAERVGLGLIKAVLWGYGINQVTGMIGGMAASAGTVYHGDFNATQSLNTSSQGQAFDYSYAPIGE